MVQMNIRFDTPRAEANNVLRSGISAADSTAWDISTKPTGAVAVSPNGIFVSASNFKGSSDTMVVWFVGWPASGGVGRILDTNTFTATANATDGTSLYPSSNGCTVDTRGMAYVYPYVFATGTSLTAGSSVTLLFNNL